MVDGMTWSAWWDEMYLSAVDQGLVIWERLLFCHTAMIEYWQAAAADAAAYAADDVNSMLNRMRTIDC